MARVAFMMSLRFPDTLSHIVCVGAHADDIEIGAAGTIAAIARDHADAHFTFIVLTGDDRRRPEAERSAHALVGPRCEVHVAEFADTLLPYSQPVQVKDYLATAAPAAADLVLAPRRDDRHQDHRFAANLVDQVFRQSLILHYEVVNNDRDLGNPNVFVELTAVQADQKIDHLLSHYESQHGKPWYTEEVFRSVLVVRGLQSGADSGLAEGFVANSVLARSGS